MVRGDHIDAFGGRVHDHVECAYDVGVRNQEYDQHDHAYDDAALDCGAAALEFGDAFHDCVDSAHGLDTLAAQHYGACSDALVTLLMST
jgi:hypothetical protein